MEFVPVCDLAASFFTHSSPLLSIPFPLLTKALFPSFFFYSPGFFSLVPSCLPFPTLMSLQVNVIWEVRPGQRKWVTGGGLEQCIPPFSCHAINCFFSTMLANYGLQPLQTISQNNLLSFKLQVLCTRSQQRVSK